MSEILKNSSINFPSNIFDDVTEHRGVRQSYWWGCALNEYTWYSRTQIFDRSKVYILEEIADVTERLFLLKNLTDN